MILDQQSCKNSLQQGLLGPLPQVRLGKEKQGALHRLCRVIANATTLNLSAARARC